MSPFFYAAPAALVMSLAATSAFAENTPAEFAVKANSAGTFEILSSELALKRSKNPQVREFAEKMIADHSKASRDLGAAVAGEGLSAHPALLDEKHRDQFDKLMAASDADFDKTYIDLQTAAHKDAIDLFKDYAEDGAEGPLKVFASETLAVLTLHEAHVKALDKYAD